MSAKYYVPPLERAFYAAQQKGVPDCPSAGPAANGESAVAAPDDWLRFVTTREDGVTCDIRDVRRVFLEHLDAASTTGQR